MTYKEQYPEFLEETMFAEHGTRVLITDRAADDYLNRHKSANEKLRLKRIRKRSSQSVDDN
jgi:hypothetical protein